MNAFTAHHAVTRAILFLVCALCANVSALHGQRWEKISPGWTTGGIFDLLQWNGDSLLAAGANGTLLLSPDAGATWNQILDERHTFQITSLDKLNGFLYFTAQLNKWEATLSGTADTTNRLYQYDVSNGILRDISVRREHPSQDRQLVPTVTSRNGSLFLSDPSETSPTWTLRLSTDGGATWVSHSLPGPLAGYLPHSDSILVWFAYTPSLGKLRAFRSTDAGITWDSTGQSFTSEYYETVHLDAALTGTSISCVAGFGATALSSGDSGRTWLLSDPIPWGVYNKAAIASIGIANDGTTYVSGFESDVYKKPSNAAGWVQIHDGDPYPFVRPGTILVSESGALTIATEDGIIYRSTNDGITWETLRLGDIREIESLHFFDTEAGILTARTKENEHYIFSTRDGGKSWSKTGAYYSTNDIKFIALKSFTEIDAYTMEYGDTASVFTHLRSSDQGMNWTQIHKTATGFGGKNVRRILFNDSDFLAFVTLSNAPVRGIWFSSDAGRTWSFSATGDSLTGNRNLVFARSAAGDLLAYLYTIFPPATLYKSTDSCRSWTEMPGIQNLGSSLADVTAVGADTLIAKTNTGIYGVRYSLSTDGGQSWSVIGETEEQGGSVTFYPFPAMYTLAYSLYLSKTTDYWNTIDVQIALDFGNRPARGFFLSADIGWVAAGRTIYRTTTGGVNWVRQPGAIEPGVSITSIYPNPVSTHAEATVEYTLSATANISLTLYNALGQQVRHVVKRMERGTHIERIGTAGLAPGIYYYTLLAGGHRQTKMMAVR